MAITAITSVEQFDELVLGSKELVIVDFWAGWCEPCTVMRPEVEAVAEKLEIGRASCRERVLRLV